VAFMSFCDVRIAGQTRFFSVYFIWRTYRTALQQILKLFITFSKTSAVSFDCKAFLGHCWQQSVEYCFSVCRLHEFLWDVLAEVWRGVRTGDRDGRRPRPTMRSPRKSCSKAVAYTVRAVAHHVEANTSSHLSALPQRPTCLLSKALFMSRQFFICFCLIRYFLVRISVVEYFTKSSSKGFRCDVMFTIEYTFHSWVRLVCTCTALNWREQRPSNRSGLDSSVTGDVGSLLHVSDLIFVP
jgi:hypothetical protein